MRAIALDDCKNGNTEAGIPVLEKKAAGVRLQRCPSGLRNSRYGRREIYVRSIA